jgi:hypothetical protein
MYDCIITEAFKLITKASSSSYYYYYCRRPRHCCYCCCYYTATAAAITTTITTTTTTTTTTTASPSVERMNVMKSVGQGGTGQSKQSTVYTGVRKILYLFRKFFFGPLM